MEVEEGGAREGGRSAISRTGTNPIEMTIPCAQKRGRQEGKKKKDEIFVYLFAVSIPEI